MEGEISPEVKAQVEAAKKKHAEIYGKTVVEPEPPKEEEVPPAPEPTEEPVAVEEEVKAEEEPKKEPEPAKEPVAEDWKAKYSVLEGKYNAEVPRLQEEVRQLRQLVILHQQSKVEPEPKAVERPPKSPTKPIEVKLDESEAKSIEDSFDHLGPEVVKYIKDTTLREKRLSAALESKDKRIEALESKVSQVDGSVSEVHAAAVQTREERYWKHLQDNVPNLAEVNADVKFKEWLLQVDPMTGIQRDVLLKDAEQKRDASRIVAIIETFTGKKAGQVAPKKDLSKGITPSRSTSGQRPEPSAKPTMTKKDWDAKMAKLVEDYRNGKIPNRADYDKRYRELHSAITEGRVV